jgi:Zn-dependent peptidase ImmA (M78 family)/DNA-binding XRE family transcriptional regulator
MKVNGQMVTLAREFRELTQQALAQQVGVAQSTIAKVEAALRNELDDALAQRVSDVLGFPLSFFSQNEELLSFGSSSYFYRKRASLTAADRKRIHSIVNLQRIALRQMLRHVDIEPRRKLPQFDLEEYGQSAVLAAQALRSFWALPDGPVRDLTDLVEGAGVLIFRCKFESRKFDGTSLRLADMPPMIFMNEELPGDRWRFTLAHELGHLVMHTVPHEAMEDEADAFAGEFLCPEDSIKPQLMQVTRWRAREIAQLKLYWRVSLHMLVKRASDLGVIDQAQAKSAYIALAPVRQQEPIPIAQEQPKSLRRIVSALVVDLDFKLGGLAEAVHWPSELIAALLPFSEKSEPRLRLVQ